MLLGVLQTNLLQHWYLITIFITHGVEQLCVNSRYCSVYTEIYWFLFPTVTSPSFLISYGDLPIISYFRLTWSGPVAYLQKHGCPMIGIPASFEMR